MEKKKRIPPPKNPGFFGVGGCRTKTADQGTPETPNNDNLIAVLAWEIDLDTLDTVLFQYVFWSGAPLILERKRKSCEINMIIFAQIWTKFRSGG